ncbi:MAG: sugar phosphate isomerase/epimerase [Clostridia bacterium]|nr:sugar phosphate isomerase/epimerase [Clostridia bacterium]
MRLHCKCGVCSTDFESAAHTPYTAEVLFRKMKERGFEAVQFSFSSIAETDFTPNGQIEIPAVIPSAAIRAVAENAEKYGIPVEVINGTFNMAHPDRGIREEGICRFEILCRAAKELGAKYISLCSGTRNADHLWSPHSDNDTQEAWNDMLDTVSRCTKIAEEYGITLAVESEASNIISTPERARRLMDTVGSPNLKMILDCANLFHAGEAHKENVREILEHAFALYGDDIVLAHGKDIREGDGIDFCGTGLGIVDFAYTAALLEQYDFTGNMFLHGIYDENDMVRAREHWLASVR